MPIVDRISLRISFGRYMPICNFCASNGKCVAPLHKDLEKCDCDGEVLINYNKEPVCEKCRRSVIFNFENQGCKNFVPLGSCQIGALVKNK